MDIMIWNTLSRPLSVSLIILHLSLNYHLFTPTTKNFVKCFCIPSFSDPHFPAFGLNMESYPVNSFSVQMQKNADQKNSEYGHFLSSDRSNSSLVFYPHDYFGIFHKIQMKKKHMQVRFFKLLAYNLRVYLKGFQHRSFPLIYLFCKCDIMSFQP